MYNGRVIHDARVALHLSQGDLAAGITDQETISHLENNRVTPRERTIRAIVNRLHLQLEDIIVDLPNNANYSLPAVEKLIRQRYYTKAIDRIQKIQPDTFTEHTTLQADFFLAFAKLCLSGDMNQAIFDFSRGILGNGNQLIDFFATLCFEQLGMIYCRLNKMTDATYYLEQVPQLLKTANKSDIYWTVFIYNDLATFYAKTHDYPLSNHYALIGLKLLQKNHQSQFADSLSLTVGKNYTTTRKWKTSLAKHYLVQARDLAKFNHDPAIAAAAIKILAQHQ